MKNPYLPENMPKYIIIDYRAKNEIINLLVKNNIKVIKSIKCDELQDPVNGHPDMVMHMIDGKTIIVAPNVFDYYYDIFKNKGIKVIKGGKTLSRNYPDDIAYNVARIGKYAIHNVKYTDEILKYYLTKLGIEFIHVNQGYTKCSIACVSETKAITSDLLIKKRLCEYGIECLYVNPEIIYLRGYNYGFIGGCIGALNSEVYLMTGRIENNNIMHELKNFIQPSGFVFVEASADQITDLGTLIPIN